MSIYYTEYIAYQIYSFSRSHSGSTTDGETGE
jgi:hypothetical protein